MKAVDPIPAKSSEQQLNETVNNDDMVNNVANMNKKQIVDPSKTQIKEHEMQDTGGTFKKNSQPIDLSNQEIFGSLVSLNEHANRDSVNI